MSATASTSDVVVVAVMLLLPLLLLLWLLLLWLLLLCLRRQLRVARLDRREEIRA